jgi:hypothetical protein
MKIRPMGAELFYAGWRMDERTDMTKLIVAFPNFPNAPKNELMSLDCKVRRFVKCTAAKSEDVSGTRYYVLWYLQLFF